MDYKNPIYHKLGNMPFHKQDIIKNINLSQIIPSQDLFNQTDGLSYKINEQDSIPCNYNALPEFYKKIHPINVKIELEKRGIIGNFIHKHIHYLEEPIQIENPLLIKKNGMYIMARRSRKKYSTRLIYNRRNTKYFIYI